jgi:hypothetical protein
MKKNGETGLNFFIKLILYCYKRPMDAGKLEKPHNKRQKFLTSYLLEEGYKIQVL